ncbi:DUF4158 domain-containing protein [Actinomadura sp. NPDC048955]|uniref:DUF4158 domain-containing protein n=1 Tax=Actinomadura sp. NPDC048955 TaxID=3158228 RepID=UPI0033CEABED
MTDEQAEAYGEFAEEPTRPELGRFFFLDDVDRDLIALRRSTHHQLGFALQFCTVRYIGRFLPDDPLDAPWPVVEHLAAQLGIEDPSVVKRYTERPKTPYEHAWEIRDAYEYHEYEDPEWSRRFRTFLYGRAWTHAEGPKALFDHAVGWLRRNRVLLPGVSVLARQVSEVRKVADKRLHVTVAGAARRADAALPGDLVGDAEDAGGLPVLGAGAAAPAADAYDGHGVRARFGAGGRDRRVPAWAAEAVADPAEPDGGAGPVRTGVEGGAAGAGGGAEAYGDATKGRKATPPIAPEPSGPSRYLREAERIHIADRIREGASQRTIAGELGRHPSTSAARSRRWRGGRPPAR